jgi:hypothetical protein
MMIYPRIRTATVNALRGNERTGYELKSFIAYCLILDQLFRCSRTLLTRNSQFRITTRYTRSNTLHTTNHTAKSKE